MAGRSAQAALDELGEVVEELDRIEARRDALAAEAWSLGATQAQVAVTLGVSQAAVSRLIRRPVEVTDRSTRGVVAGLGEEARLARMDPDLLAEVMRTTVADAAAWLSRDPARAREGEDLARASRATRARDPQGRIDLILRARSILAQAGD